MTAVAGAGILMLCCLASSGGAYIFSQQEDPLAMGPSLSAEALAQLEIDRAAAQLKGVQAAAQLEIDRAAAQLEADQAVTGCVGNWDTTWDNCSATCGGGKQYKYWNTTAEPRNGGTPCPDPEIKERSCNNEVCPGDEVQHCLGSHDTEWSACSATCGGGIQTKIYNVTQYPQNEGNECLLDITHPCNPQACPTAAEVAAAEAAAAAAAEAAAEAPAATAVEAAAAAAMANALNAMSSFSDRRLKRGIKYVYTYKGYKVYSWEWNDIAMSTYGLRGGDIGFITDELEDIYVGTDAYGYEYIKGGTQPDNILREVRT